MRTIWSRIAVAGMARVTAGKIEVLEAVGEARPITSEQTIEGEDTGDSVRFSQLDVDPASGRQPAELLVKDHLKEEAEQEERHRRPEDRQERGHAVD